MVPFNIFGSNLFYLLIQKRSINFRISLELKPVSQSSIRRTLAFRTSKFDSNFRQLTKRERKRLERQQLALLKKMNKKTEKETKVQMDLLRGFEQLKAKNANVSFMIFQDVLSGTDGLV